MGSMVRLQTSSQVRGAPFLDLHYPSLWCRLAPRRKLLVLTPDPDARSRAEQPELEWSYAAVSRPLPRLLHTSLVYHRTFSIMSHVPVATVGSLYER
jgi:hypothetical protein